MKRPDHMDVFSSDDGSTANQTYGAIKTLADKYPNGPSGRDGVGVRGIMRDDGYARVVAEHFKQTVRAFAARGRHGFRIRRVQSQRLAVFLERHYRSFPAWGPGGPTGKPRKWLGARDLQARGTTSTLSSRGR